VDQCDGYTVANSVRAVALDVFEREPDERRNAIVADLLNRNSELVVAVDRIEAFHNAHTPAEFMTDLVCEVVAAVLRREPELAFEDNCRMAEAID
jgi:hypothetical protein